MSVAPKTTISMQPSPTRNYGFGIAFALPASTKEIDPEQLRALVGASLKSTSTATEDALRERLNAHAKTLPLPPVAVVTGQMASGDTECGDLLTVVTVLAKSSSRVYLRDKEPNLAAIVPGRRVVLVVPREVKL
jgi:hypothetical protein